MSHQLLYLDIIRVLDERNGMPIEMLALKVGLSTGAILGLLEKLEKLNVVKIDSDRKNVELAYQSNIPTMKEFYALAG